MKNKLSENEITEKTTAALNIWNTLKNREMPDRTFYKKRIVEFCDICESKGIPQWIAKKVFWFYIADIGKYTDCLPPYVYYDLCILHKHNDLYKFVFDN